MSYVHAISQSFCGLQENVLFNVHVTYTFSYKFFFKRVILIAFFNYILHKRAKIEMGQINWASK